MVNKGKLDTDFDLWIRCWHGDQEALDYMFEYNQEDVLLLEEVYLQLMPWIRPHPNYALYAEANEPCCIYCGSTKLEDAGIYVTPANRYHTYRCLECNGINRDHKSDLTRTEREGLLLSVAR